MNPEDLMRVMNRAGVAPRVPPSPGTGAGRVAASVGAVRAPNPPGVNAGTVGRPPNPVIGGMTPGAGGAVAPGAATLARMQGLKDKLAGAMGRPAGGPQTQLTDPGGGGLPGPRPVPAPAPPAPMPAPPPHAPTPAPPPMTPAPPALPRPAAPAPAPAPAAGPASGGIAGMIEQALMGGLNGEGPYSKAILQNMDDEVFNRVRSGTDQANAATRGALARSGMFRGTLPAEAMSRAESAGLGEYTRGLGENRRRAAEGNYAARDATLGRAIGYQQSRDEMQQRREEAAAARAAGGGRGEDTITLTNPDGSTSEIPTRILDLLSQME